MSRKIVSKFAIILALTVLALSNDQMQAQQGSTPPPPTIVTGGDPQPIGPAVTMLTLLPIVIAIVTK